MARITDYASLQANVATWVNRAGSAFSDDVPTMIQLGESMLRRDVRVRELTALQAFSITGDGDALPTDYAELDSWYYDGPTYYGPIEIVSDLGVLKQRFGIRSSGVPRYAVIKKGQLYYAPEPDETFSTQMSYRRKITALSDSNTSNWLLEEHPDIYLYAALAEAEPYLKDREWGQYWEAKLEAALDELRIGEWEAPAGGGRVRRHHRPIG